MLRIFSVFLLSILAVEPALVSAQQPDATLATPLPARIPVNAPFAQKLIMKVKRMHPEIQKLGLHAVPPGQSADAIIASNLPEKIGKVSSSNDLRIVASGEPQAVRVDAGRFWDTFVPIHDRSGVVMGFLVMEVPFSIAPTQEHATAKGIEICHQVEEQIPDRAVLFSIDGKE